MADSYTFIKTLTGVLQRSPDGAFVPLDLDNMDYQEFLSWLVEPGNTAPEGWTGPTNTSG